MAARRSPKNPPSINTYYDALRREFATQWAKMTTTLPHHGERGRNDEERLRRLLRQILPRKYQIGTGFVATAHPRQPMSGQLDILVYDEQLNAPLFEQLIANVYPIEAVYAAIEVKSTLSVNETNDALKKLGTLRRIGKLGKTYVVYPLSTKKRGKKTLLVSAPASVTSDLAPRTFVFAYDTDVKRRTSLERRIDKIARKKKAFVHAAYVVRKDWLIWHDNDGRIHSTSGDGLFQFCSRLLHSINSIQMLPGHFMMYASPNIGAAQSRGARKKNKRRRR